MEKKEVIVNGKSFVLRELLAIELDEILKNNSDSKDILKKQICISSGITEEEYNNLTVRERLSISLTMNELNGTEDFLKRFKTE